MFAITHCIERPFLVDVYSMSCVRYFFPSFHWEQCYDPFGFVYSFERLDNTSLEIVPIYTFQTNRKIVSETKEFTHSRDVRINDDNEEHWTLQWNHFEVKKSVYVNVCFCARLIEFLCQQTIFQIELRSEIVLCIGVIPRLLCTISYLLSMNRQYTKRSHSFDLPRC